MRFRTMSILGLALAAVLGIGLAAGPAQAETLRVMTFNVRVPVVQDGANGWDRRKAMLARLIARSAADVVGTQELTKGQGDYLLARLPGYAWLGQGRRGGHEDEHMGIFYRRDRLRLVELGNFALSDTPDVPGSISWGHPYPRMVTCGLFEHVSDRRRFYLYNTHFPYRAEDEPARLKAAQAISAKVTAASPPVVKGFVNQSAAPFRRLVVATEADTNGDRWGLRQVDLAVTKYVPLKFLTEESRMRLRVDIINLFNDRNYADYITDPNDLVVTPTSTTVFGDINGSPSAATRPGRSSCPPGSASDRLRPRVARPRAAGHPLRGVAPLGARAAVAAGPAPPLHRPWAAVTDGRYE
jgi:endonuclease/exonuclease/phosphatase family metal-dependent hydrolase